jgi:O-acetylserine/cysteine efflux transporter
MIEQNKNIVAGKHPSDYPRPMTRQQILMALVPPLCFGTGFTIAKPAVAHFPPLFMMLMVYAGIALYFLLASRQPLKTPWPSVLLISSCAVTIQGALLFTGLKDLPASTANLVLQIQVPMTVILGWLFGGEEFSLRRAIGTAVALAGVAIVIGLPNEPPPLWPVTLVILGAFVWALGQLFARRFGRDDGMGILRANAYGSVPQLTLATLLFERGQIEAVASAGLLEWGMLAFVGVIGFFVAYASWFHLLRQCRIDDVAPFILLMTPVGLITAAALLGESISGIQIAGGLVLLGGLLTVTGLGALRPRRA